MKIAIGTLNKAKISAVEEVIKKVWNDAEFYPIETDSKVSNQPLHGEESITGAINRAKEAIIKVNKEHNINVDFGIGLEGGVHTIHKYGMFSESWVAIIDVDGNIGLGRGASVELPKRLSDRLNAGEELGPVMQELMKDDANTIRHTLGTGGILTKGMYTRVDEFEDATRCALARFVSKEWYR